MPEYRRSVPLADYTTIGLGGPARFFAECSSEAEVRDALAFATANDLPVLVLGGGSNLLIADRGWDGLVLHVALKGLEWDLSVGRVTAAAGEDWDSFVRACVDRDLQGLECLSGIPGLVGGTPIQNVGAYGQEVAERIESVRAIDRESGESLTIPGARCDFAYRMSRFKSTDAGRFIVTAVTYRLGPGAPPDIRYEELKRRLAETTSDTVPGLKAVRETVLALRRGKSMVYDPADPDSRSLGSFFMNPILSEIQFADFLEKIKNDEILGDPPRFPAGPGAPTGSVKVPAAWLIERAGFAKGQTLGGAGISTKHALSIVNRGGTTDDVLALAGRIQATVRERFGIELHREPVLVG